MSKSAAKTVNTQAGATAPAADIPPEEIARLLKQYGTGPVQFSGQRLFLL